MIAAIELVTVRTDPCPSCSQRHRHRMAVTAGEATVQDGHLGFFGSCPRSGQRVWLVAPAPRAPDGTSRFRGVGPADVDDWFPDDDWLPDSEPDRSDWAVAPRVAAGSLHRESRTGGFRDHSRTPDLVRQVLGCPFS